MNYYVIIAVKVWKPLKIVSAENWEGNAIDWKCPNHSYHGAQLIVPRADVRFRSEPNMRWKNVC